MSGRGTEQRIDTSEAKRNMSKPEDNDESESLDDSESEEQEPEVRTYIPDVAFRSLNPMRCPEFEDEMQEFWAWLLACGADIDEEEGQTESTAKNNIQRVGRILPIIWEEFDGYTLAIQPGMADWFVDQLDDDEITKENGEPYADSAKRKEVCALLAYTRFRWDQRTGEAWEPDKMFGAYGQGSPIADPVSPDERAKIREASLEYKTVKAYSNCTPEERDRYKQYLAHRLGKPKDEITKADWEQVNRSWKVPALVGLALDIGLRPEEVARAKVGWLKLSGHKIEIPQDEAVKNDDGRVNSITDRTKRALERWKQQRKTRPKYDDTDLLFLTQVGNPYSSRSLGNLLRGVMDEAEIDYSDRDISWYSLRTRWALNSRSKTT